MEAQGRKKKPSQIPADPHWLTAVIAVFLNSVPGPGLAHRSMGVCMGGLGIEGGGP